MNVDILKTTEYCRSIGETSLCDCAYCRSYRLQVKSAFPEASEYLDSLGVDIEKPLKHRLWNLMKMECWTTAAASISYSEAATHLTTIKLMVWKFALQPRIRILELNRNTSFWNCIRYGLNFVCKD